MRIIIVLVLSSATRWTSLSPFALAPSTNPKHNHWKMLHSRFFMLASGCQPRCVCECVWVFGNESGIDASTSWRRRKFSYQWKKSWKNFTSSQSNYLDYPSPNSDWKALKLLDLQHNTIIWHRSLFSLSLRTEFFTKTSPHPCSGHGEKMSRATKKNFCFRIFAIFASKNINFSLKIP